jgi:DNA invertase Pin-like site-specific DNA recombinase
MTYGFNSTKHSESIKAGQLRAKQQGKTLGRRKGNKIIGEDEVLSLYLNDVLLVESKDIGDDKSGIAKVKRMTRQDIANTACVSLSTVRNIINKYNKNKK